MSFGFSAPLRSAPPSHGPITSLAPLTGRFAFTKIASDRAKQLIRGAQPRLPQEHGGPAKSTSIAMREVRAGLVRYRLDEPDERDRVSKIFDVEALAHLAGASVSGGSLIVITDLEMVHRVKTAWSVLRETSTNPMESMRQALRTHDDEVFSWSTWADAASSHVDVGLDESTASAVEGSLDVALTLTEASWRSRTCDDPITCVLTIPDSEHEEVSIDAPFGALVMYPGSLTMKLAFKFKKPVGFALALIRNKGVVPSQLADSIHRALRDGARKKRGVEDLVSIFDMTEATIKGKTHLLLFVHGLISTDLGLFDALIRRFRSAMPTLQLVGYPHNTFSSIETNALVLADWIEKLIAGNDIPLAFVCHSRGGLVARTAAVELLERNKSWEGRLRGCVTFGTPHEGAAFAEVAEDFYPTFASLATLNGTRNVLSSIDVLTYFGAGGKFEGIEDLRPLTGAGSTRERFLKKLREREGRVKRLDLLAFGGRIALNGHVAKLTRRFLAGRDSDQVVELSSSTPDLLKPHQRVVTTCNHFDYFSDAEENDENLAVAEQYVSKVLHEADVQSGAA